MTEHTDSPSRKHLPEKLSLGVRVRKLTSQVKLNWPITAASGQLGKREIYYMRGSTCVARAYVVPFDPRSASQVPKRGYMGEARFEWRNVPLAEREAWKAFALEHIWPERRGRKHGASLAGYNAFTATQIFHQGMGYPLTMTTPTRTAPGPVVEIEQVPPPDDQAYAFVIRHGETDLEGLRLLVEITPAMPTLKRNPRPKELRWAAQNDPESFLPLGPDGSLYLIPVGRFAVEAGRVFGVRARIVTEEGMRGKALAVKLLRSASAPEDWAEEAP